MALCAGFGAEPYCGAASSSAMCFGPVGVSKTLNCADSLLASWDSLACATGILFGSFLANRGVSSCFVYQESSLPSYFYDGFAERFRLTRGANPAER
jgi:hypothetical protein